MPNKKSMCLSPVAANNPTPAAVVAWCTDPLIAVERVYLTTSAAYTVPAMVSYYRDLSVALRAAGIELFATFGDPAWADAGADHTHAQYRNAAEWVKASLLLQAPVTGGTRLFDGVLITTQPTWFLAAPVQSHMHKYIIMQQQCAAEANMLHTTSLFPVQPAAPAQVWLYQPLGLGMHTMTGYGPFDRVSLSAAVGVEYRTPADSVPTLQAAMASANASSNAVGKPVRFTVFTQNAPPLLTFFGKTRTYMAAHTQSAYNNLSPTVPLLDGFTVFHYATWAAMAP
jgi:hypothetical protein